MNKAITVMMSKAEAAEKDTLITTKTDSWYHSVGPLLVEMREREGWKALGHESFKDYMVSLDERFQHRSAINRLIDRTDVERNIGHQLPARHAYVLARLPTPEAQREVYIAVIANYSNPVERNFEAYVDKWFRDNEPAAPRSRDKKPEDGWTRGDLEEDDELAGAFTIIERVYGHADRKAIQNGTVGLTRKDVIALSRFHPSKMREVQSLIMHLHWNVADSFKFVNKSMSQRDDIGTLINHGLGTIGLRYVTQVDGWDITIAACAALSKKIRG